MLARNLIALIGLLLLMLGCHLAWPPLAPMVGGVVLLFAAVFGHLRSGGKDR